MDPIDKMLQGDDTTQGVTSQTDGQQTDSTQATRPVEQQTDEEVEFNKLTGHTQDRFRELLRRAKEAEAKLGTQQTYVPTAPNMVTPDQEQAVETLSKFGIATDKKVDEKVSAGLNQIKWELRQANLEQKYVGQDGEPKFDREEVEDYMRSHPQYQYYDPEDVFKYKMFPDEFSGQSQQTTKTRTSSLRPTKAQTRQDALTPDFIEERLKQADGAEWYDAHLDEINAVVKNYTNQFKGKNLSGQ